ncbi:MAG: hypothetical protein SFU86_05450 [Pirellulaceae bacterium]|nr:hypothetical protein [Pirellulaceae bacterium]
MASRPINLSSIASRQIAAKAAFEGRPLEVYIVEILDEEIARSPRKDQQHLSSLSDVEVLAMADLQMTDEQSERMSELLELNRESRLSSDQRGELDILLKLYSIGTLQKAKGWAEVVRRKLRPSPF